MEMGGIVMDGVRRRRRGLHKQTEELGGDGIGGIELTWGQREGEKIKRESG